MPSKSSSYANPVSIEAQTKDAWSADTDELDEPHDGYDDGSRPARAGSREDDEYALLHSVETEDGHHPGRPISWGGTSSLDDRNETAYHSTVERYDEPSAPSALSPGGYRDGGAAEFPKAKYTFSGGDIR